MEPAISDLLYESFWLLVIGMAVVFSFLTMLIGGIKLIEKFCAAFPQDEPTNKPALPSALSQQHSDISPQVVAAITAAIHQHRQK